MRNGAVTHIPAPCTHPSPPQGPWLPVDPPLLLPAAFMTMVLIFLHTFWGILFFHGCENQRWWEIAAVVLMHLAVSGSVSAASRAPCCLQGCCHTSLSHPRPSPGFPHHWNHQEGDTVATWSSRAVGDPSHPFSFLLFPPPQTFWNPLYVGSLVPSYLLMAAAAVWAYLLSGGSAQNLRRFLLCKCLVKGHRDPSGCRGPSGCWVLGWGKGLLGNEARS